MKNLTTTKKSVLAITISLTIVLFAILLMNCISAQPNLSQNENALIAKDNGGISGNNLLRNSRANDLDEDFYIANLDGDALLLAGVIFGKKSDVAEIVDVQFGSANFSHAENLSQDYINGRLELKYNIIANGTCSLVAMIIASDALGINDNIPEFRDLSEDDKYAIIIKELYDIAISFGNNYSGAGGTSVDTIPLILNQFYSNHGYNYDLRNIKLKSDLRKNVEEKRKSPSLITMFNGYDVQHDQYVDGHTVALVGSYKINIRYRKRGMLFKQNGVFNAFVICDGWTNSDNGKFGENYQVLIFNTDVKNSIYLVNLS